MSSIASLGRMISGMGVSQRGLQVTSHNITNANTPGYIRQQLLQHDSRYLNIGSSGQSLQVGIGVTPTEIRQIRDEFSDRRFRVENSVMSYYATKKEAIDEIEVIFGEPHAEALSTSMNQFWQQTQKLATNPAGIEERMAFIQSAYVFVEQSNHIANQLVEYQHNLDAQVKETVNKINTLTKNIQNINEEIALYEVGEDNANDLRDKRNNFLDELSSLIDIQYREESDGRVVVYSEGVTLVEKQFRTEMATTQAKEGSPFVNPIWKNAGVEVYPMNKAATTMNGTDNGKLRALVMMRGKESANYDTDWDDIAINTNISADQAGNAYVIPKIQKEFDTFIHTLVSTINEVFVPSVGKQPIGQGQGNISGTQLFVVKNPNVTELKAGNIQINPDLLKDGGYNLLPTSLSGDQSDTTVIKKLLEEWNTEKDWFDNATSSSFPHQQTSTFRGFYSDFIARIGAEGKEATGRVEEKTILITNIENARQSMGGVSTDEEMTNMMKYQYSYNAAARMITVLDGMLDTVINRMGR